MQTAIPLKEGTPALDATEEHDFYGVNCVLTLKLSSDRGPQLTLVGNPMSVHRTHPAEITHSTIYQPTTIQ